MALAADTSMIQAGIFVTPAVGDPANVAGGSNSFVGFGVGGGEVLLNSGLHFIGNSLLAREVGVGTSGLFGKTVQVTGKGPSFRGAVIAAVRIELGTTGGTGALTECVFVQGPEGFRFLALVSAVEEVPS